MNKSQIELTKMLEDKDDIDYVVENETMRDGLYDKELELNEITDHMVSMIETKIKDRSKLKAFEIFNLFHNEMLKDHNEELELADKINQDLMDEIEELKKGSVVSSMQAGKGWN